SITQASNNAVELSSVPQTGCGMQCLTWSGRARGGRWRPMPLDPSLIDIETHVEKYLRANDHVGYNRFADFDWATLPESVARSSLRDLHINAVETAMLVEDHIPGYGAEYTRLFSMTEPGRDDVEAWRHRQMLHFVFRWVAEEDRHAHLLELWLRHSGRRDPERLTQLM